MLEGLQTIVRVRVVGLLLGLMVVVEILGFSFNSLLPAIADSLLGVGPEGLGTLMSGAALGSMAGTAFLAFAYRSQKGPMLLGVVSLFGVLLVGLAASRSFLLSVVIVGAVGAMAAMVDALEWMLLQASVDKRLRGRVLGAWNLAVGWGWIGPVVLGALSEWIGVGSALALSGVSLALIGALFAFKSRVLRQV